MTASDRKLTTSIGVKLDRTPVRLGQPPQRRRKETSGKKEPFVRRGDRTAEKSPEAP
jgi:hypothetical protein